MSKENNIHFSSKDTTWETPQDFYDKLNGIFKFTLDPCCSPFTAKCKKYFTPKDDGLVQSWEGETVFMNPPYGRGMIEEWVKKANIEKALTVGLIPARTDTKWMHENIFSKVPYSCYDFDFFKRYCDLFKSNLVWFVKGRLKFGGSKNSAPFPSMVVVWRND